MPSQPRALGLFIALTLLVSGSLLAGGHYAQLSGYERTTATVETARIQSLHDGGANSTRVNATSTDTENDTVNRNVQEPEFGLVDGVYAPNVTYTYSVGGQQYTGTNVAAGTDIVTDNRPRVASLLPVSRAGVTTTVYYDPANPGDAHLLHRYQFFPAGLLLVTGLLVLTDTLTPNLRFVGFLTRWVPYSTLERVPGVERTALSDPSDDPTAILDSLRRWEGTGPAPIRTGASPAVWVLCYLFLVDLALVYFLLSSRPYDLWALVPVFAATAGFMRMAFLRLVD